MKNLPVYIILIITVSFVTGCGLFGSRNSIGQTHFPLTPGSSWTYAVYDSVPVPPERDTVQVSILKTDTTSEEIQSLWELKYTGHTDSITVVSSRNTLRFDFPQGFPGTKLIVFPLKVGKKWSDANSSYAVVSKDTVSWSGGTFYKSYQIVQKASKKPNNDIQSITHDTTNYWIEPGIGIVKVRQFEYIAGPPGMADYVSDTVWMLLSYKINQM